MSQHRVYRLVYILCIRFYVYVLLIRIARPTQSTPLLDLSLYSSIRIHIIYTFYVYIFPKILPLHTMYLFFRKFFPSSFSKNFSFPSTFLKFFLPSKSYYIYIIYTFYVYVLRTITLCSRRAPPRFAGRVY